MGRISINDEKYRRESENREQRFKVVMKVWIASMIICVLITAVFIYKISEAKPHNKQLYAEEKIIDNKCVSLVKENEQLEELYEGAKNVNSELEALQNEAFDLISQLEKQIQNGETDYKLFYFTFDDGPYAMTDEFLKVLDENHIQATFFTTSINGAHCFDNKNVKTAPFYGKYIKYGHTIGNHTYTHGLFNGLYDSKKSFVKAITDQEEYVNSLTGYKTRIFRFPGGSATAGNLKKPIIEALRKKGYGWVDWTVETGDGGALESSEVGFKNFKKGLNSPIEVCLCHDYSGKTLKILPKMIDYAKDRHYVFAPLFYDSVMVNK